MWTLNPPPRPLERGDRVIVTSRNWAANAVIAEIAEPEILCTLNVEGCPDPASIRLAIQRLNVIEVALIEYEIGGRQHVIAAMHKAQGGWQDISGRTLRIQRSEP